MFLSLTDSNLALYTVVEVLVYKTTMQTSLLSSYGHF